MTIVLTTALAADEPELPIEIDSDSGGYDVGSGAYRLEGNVRIARGSLLVLADEARSFNGEDGQPQRIELYGSPTRWSDVMEDGSDVEGQSDEIVYDFTRNLITMKGNAEIENVQGTFSGSTLVYDLDNQNLVGDGGVRLIIQPEAAERAAEQVPRGDTTDAEPEESTTGEQDTDPDPEN
jgi:lipopolysaccharide export system protein LptA